MNYETKGKNRWMKSNKSNVNVVAIETDKERVVGLYEVSNYHK